MKFRLRGIPLEANLNKKSKRLNNNPNHEALHCDLTFLNLISRSNLAIDNLIGNEKMNFIEFKTIEDEEILINLEQVVSIKPYYNQIGNRTGLTEIVLNTSESVTIKAPFSSLMSLVQE